jgi:hypothetical protein
MKLSKMLIGAAVAAGAFLLWRYYGEHVRTGAAKVSADNSRDLTDASNWRLPWNDPTSQFGYLSEAIANAIGKTPITVK